jgi:hypothetical protein
MVMATYIRSCICSSFGKPTHANCFVSGHGFSRALTMRKLGFSSWEKPPARAKALFFLQPLQARLKPCPDTIFKRLNEVNFPPYHGPCLRPNHQMTPTVAVFWSLEKTFCVLVRKIGTFDQSRRYSYLISNPLATVTS